MTHTRMSRAAVWFASIGIIAGSLAISVPASADTVYQPPSGTFNGYIVYLSRACHNGKGTTCKTNTGCSSYSENANSASVSTAAATHNVNGDSLTKRGYRVYVGTGTMQQNIANSNAAGADIHIPIHSNAQGTGAACGGSTSPANNGTWGMYKGFSGCATQMKTWVGGASPGTNDKIVYRGDLAELNNTNAVGCYLESEFHTWPAGVTWLNQYYSWSWRLGAAVDSYLGYP